MRRLPVVQTASMGVIQDPRLASWAEMCAIAARAFVVRHPTRCYAPTSDEFVKEQGPRRWSPSTLGSPRRWPPKSALAAKSGA